MASLQMAPSANHQKKYYNLFSGTPATLDVQKHNVFNENRFDAQIVPGSCSLLPLLKASRHNENHEKLLQGTTRDPFRIVSFIKSQMTANN